MVTLKTLAGAAMIVAGLFGGPAHALTNAGAPPGAPLWKLEIEPGELCMVSIGAGSTDIRLTISVAAHGGLGIGLLHRDWQLQEGADYNFLLVTDAGRWALTARAVHPMMVGARDVRQEVFADLAATRTIWLLDPQGRQITAMQVAEIRDAIRAALTCGAQQALMHVGRPG